MNYLLKTELGLPLYSSLSDSLAAAELNKSIIVVKPKKITTLQILNLLGATSGATFLKTLETISTTNDSVRFATRSIDSIGVDVGNAVTRGMLDSFVTANLLPAADVKILKDTASVPTTRAEELGIAPVRIGEITRARV